MDEYKQKNPYAAREKEDTLEKLAERLTDRGADGAQMLKTIAEFNGAVDDSVEFNPYAKDGRHTSGLAIEKTNWAQALVEPPFEAYEVTCGITFTFGGVRVGSDGAVLDAGKKPIPGIYAAGEMVGGLYYFNYASGTGLTSGAVLGLPRRAGGRRGLRQLMNAPQMLVDRRGLDRPGVRPVPLPGGGRVREREDSDRTVRRQLRLLASRLRLAETLGAIEGEGESAKLIDTLDAFFAANGSVRATAAGLAIHENTVRHRFRRLAAATGLDVLGSTDDRLTARMALTLHRLRSNAPARKEPKWRSIGEGSRTPSRNVASRRSAARSGVTRSFPVSRTWPSTTCSSRPARARTGTRTAARRSSA